MIIVGNLQPLEGLVRFAAPSVNLSNLVRQQVSVIGDHIGQRCVRGRSIPSRVMCKREFETPVTFVRLKLSFAQSGVAITSPSSSFDHTLPNDAVLTVDGVSAVSCRYHPVRDLSLWNITTLVTGSGTAINGVEQSAGAKATRLRKRCK